MAETNDDADVIRRTARPMTGAGDDYDALLELADDARFVLIGEASHGTEEFYRRRAEITKRLVEEKGFTAVAAEADWPDAYRVNRYVRGIGSDGDADAALSDFKRFPQWMWRNTVVVDFVNWLRGYNETTGDGGKVGFYGLDLYSLNASVAAVLEYLDEVDPEAARRARYRYSCFDHYGEDTQAYGYAASFGLTPSCEEQVIRQLVDLRRQAPEYIKRDGVDAADEYFYAEQNARLVRNAEEYYRSMFMGRVSSWNLRDRHMGETLDALAAFLSRQRADSKIVVWAHNSHLGDARATQMGEGGELNLGQLARERYGRNALLVGLTTYTGTVTAASAWDGPAERKRVRPGMTGSYERLFHEVGEPAFFVTLRDGGDAAGALRDRLLERAIGVIYLPQTERISHYFRAHIAEQFDAVMHIDETRALEPLERTPEWTEGEVAETYPSGL